MNSQTVWQRGQAMLRDAWRALRVWPASKIVIAALAALGTAALIGLGTVLIPNTLFTREITPEWWNYPVWLLTAVGSGILIASYVGAPQAEASARRAGRFGVAGGLLAWFAVGCPVCNKIAILALGYSGALAWFAPLQPVLALLALALTSTAVLVRLRGEVSCPLPRSARAQTGEA